MDGFTIVLAAILAVAVFLILTIILKKLGMGVKLTDGIKKKIDSYLGRNEDEDETNTHTLIIKGVNANPDAVNVPKDEWRVFAYASDGSTIRDVKFCKSDFAVDENTRREPHFTIGRDTVNSLTIHNQYKSVSKFHAYIRYDINDDAFYYWNDVASNGTFLDSQRTQPIKYGVKITDGLELFLATEVRLLFKKFF